MIEFVPCEKCKDGYIISKENDIDIITPCNCLTLYRYKIDIEQKYTKANIPIKMWDYTLDDYLGDDKNGNLIKIKMFIDKFEEKFRNIHLYFLGEWGTQKSTLARYLVKAIIDKGLTGYYLLTDTLIRNLVELHDDKKEIDIDKLLNADILICDEIDPEKVLVYNSKYQLSFFTSFLKRRLEQVGKSTIFISNNDINSKAFSDKFGETIQNLINREIKDTLIFEDNYEKLKNDFNLDDLWS